MAVVVEAQASLDKESIVAYNEQCCEVKGAIMETRRFWIRYKGSFVRLSLRDGEGISITPVKIHTQEGYSAHYARYSREGETITLETYTDARDCDGQITFDQDYVMTDECDNLEVPVAQWKTISYKQTDQYAESMGY